MQKTYVNLGIYSSSRIRFNLYKATLEARRNEAMTTDEVLNILLDIAGASSTVARTHREEVSA